MSTFREKYLKYKMKYIQLKNQLGGACNCGLSHSSIAACPNCRLEMQAAAAVMGNAEQMINVNVVAMTGKSVLFPISPNATILELKRRIQANNEIGNLEIYRQRLVYRPGPLGMESLADDLTLDECGIRQIAGVEIEVDLLLDGDLLEFSPEIIERVIGLLRNNRTEELTNLLSQYVGSLHIDSDPATQWMGTLANALRENTTVDHLAISTSIFLDEDFISLTEVLKQNTNITRLHLINMYLGNNRISALAEALKVNRYITYVNLQNNIIGDDGATQLADALKNNNTITSIDLGNNKIGDVGATELADALKSNNKITTISLDRNKIGGMGVIKLVNALKENRTVKALDLFSNMFSNYGSIRAAFRELQTARPGLIIST